MRVSCIVPALNETWSLTQTIESLMALCAEHIGEILIVIHPTKTTPQCLACAQIMAEKYSVVRILEQCEPYIGGAIRTALAHASGDAVLLMSSDLETDPKYVPAMIDLIQRDQLDIVATSRRADGGSFGNYAPLKKWLNILFQSCFRFLYKTQLTDLTYGYRLYRTSVLRGVRFECQHHAIFFEMLIRPLKCGAKVAEIPVTWTARQEGVSQIRWRDYLDYIYIGFKVLLSF